MGDVAAGDVEFIGIGEEGRLAQHIVFKKPEPIINLKVVAGDQGKDRGLALRQKDIGDGPVKIAY